MAKSSNGKQPSNRTKTDTATAMLERIAYLEETVDRLNWERHYGQRKVPSRRRTAKALAAAQDRYVRATSNGWLFVKIGGQLESLPSGLKVSLTSTTGGRDYGVALEGIHNGKNFDVTAGNLVATYRRLSDLKIKVRIRPDPIEIDSKLYDHNVSMTFKEGGTAKSAGPFRARMSLATPLPTGDHVVSIADYPHELGEGYGDYGMVWFRLGTVDAYYLHPGLVSKGCVTCAPGNWEEIYQIVNCARKNATLAGDLNYTPTPSAVALSAGRRRKAPA